MKHYKPAIFIVSTLIFSQLAFAQAQKQGAAKPKVDEKSAAIDDKKPSGPGIALDVRLGGGIALPMGSFSDVGLGLGAGGHLGVDVKMPFALGPMDLLAGAQAGFFGLGLASATTTVQASVSVMPLLVFATFAYPIKDPGITIFLGLGGGASSIGASVSGATSANLSSFDATLAFRAGAAYKIPPMPKLSVLLNLSYLMIFEANLAGGPNNASLLGVELGVSYRLVGN